MVGCLTVNNVISSKVDRQCSDSFFISPRYR